MSSNLKQKLRACCKNSLPQCNIKIILKSINCLSSFLRFKNVIPKELQSHIVYKFLCGNCNITYYGKTECHLNVGYGEHLSISYLTGKRVECKPSAVSDHLLQHNNDSDLNYFTILYRDNNGFRLLFYLILLLLKRTLYRFHYCYYCYYYYYYYLIKWNCYQWDLVNNLYHIFWYNNIKIS